MKRVKISFLAVLMVVLALTVLTYWGCDTTTNVYETQYMGESDPQLYGFIHGIVRDAQTLEPLANAQLNYVSGGGMQTVWTNNQGYYSINNLMIGEYEITCTAGDTLHSAALVAQEVSFNSGPDGMVYQGNGVYQIYYQLDIDLYPRTAGLTGTVFAALDNENVVPAAGAVIEADFTDWYTLPAVYTTTVDANGFYQFDALPAAPNVDLRVLPFTYNNVSFAVGVQNNVNLVPDATVEAPNPITLTPATLNPTVVSNNFLEGEVELDEDLIVTFSISMNPDEMDAQVYSYTSTAYISCTFSFDTTNIVMTIDPSMLLLPDRDYRLEISGESEAGAAYSDNWDFHTVVGIEFVQTNIWLYEGQVNEEFPVDSAIWVEFDQAIDPDHPDNSFVLEQGYVFPVYCDISFNVDHTMVTLTPVEPLIEGTWYELIVDAYSTLPQDHAAFTTDFRTEVSPPDIPNPPISFALETDPAAIDWNTTTLSFSWDTEDGADTYHVYARNTGAQITWIEIADFSSVYPFTTQTENVTLPSMFDYLEGDPAGQTPFSNGITLDLFLIASNESGFSGQSDPVEGVSDGVGPDLSGLTLTQDVSANNIAGMTPQEVHISLTSGFPEYCQGTPSLYIDASGAAYTTTPSSYVWAWDPYPTNGTWTLTVPAGEDASLTDILVLSIEDNSGNASTGNTVLYTLW